MQNIITWIINILTNIKNTTFKLITIFINIINNRFSTWLNKDCYGKRIYKNIKIYIINIPRQDILPLIVFILAKLYLILIIYLSFLDILSVNY